jgi:hypothetical protein
MVAFDTTFLTLMFIPDAFHPVKDAKARVNFLLSDIHGRGDKVVVPTPALAEILTKSGKARAEIIRELTNSSKFQLEPFDVRAALELSLMSDAAFTSGDKRSGAKGTWVKVKYDRQIVSIAKVSGAKIIYSEDPDIHVIGTREKIKVLGIADIKIPATDDSGFFQFDG